jgi:hypothetical protein
MMIQKLNWVRSLVHLYLVFHLIFHSKVIIKWDITVWVSIFWVKMLSQLYDFEKYIIILYTRTFWAKYIICFCHQNVLYMFYSFLYNFKYCSVA